ncbi:MAG TPA: hypothetical protein VFH94_05270 [Streptomyces sp.]|nr:hypothetical protein [Streptomyces sp.]
MRNRARRTAAAASSLAVLALVVTGCGSGDDGEKPVPETAKGSLEQLAEKVECKPNIQTDAEELRQANCKTGDGRYVLATFDSDRGQREWINEAKNYGGNYLVGRKWVAVGDQKVMTALRGQLGGEMETGSSHHSGEGGGGGNEEDHSGHHGS